MAYATTDPLICLTTAALGGSGPRLWYHESADALAAANTSGFITDGGSKGLRVGDYVWHQDTQTDGDLSMHRVITVSATYPGAVDLSDGTAICEKANAD